MKRLLFIFNPMAGRAKLNSHLLDIILFYTKNNYLVTIYCTQKKGDRYAFLRGADRSYDLIVCAGGDGTLNEVISAFLDFDVSIPLGYIPSGSTNDFAHSIGIPTNIKAAMDTTINGISYKIDIGQFNRSYFIYVAAFGIFANVSYRTPQKMKNILGYMAYILEGIKAISELKSYCLTLEYESIRIEGNFLVGLIMNSFSVAGLKMPFHTYTKLNDGIFEGLFIRMPQNLWELQSIIASLLSGQLRQSPHILFFQTNSLTIISEPINWTLDGEYGGRQRKVEINNLRKAISLKIPEAME